MEVTIVCTCSHKRNQHQAGKRSTDGYRVYDCMVDGCKCSRYNESEATTKFWNQIHLEQAKNLGLTVSIAVLIVLGFHAGVNAIFEEVHVVSDETGLAYYNATFTNSFKPGNNYDLQYSLEDYTKNTIVGLFALIVVAMTVLAIAFQMRAYYQQKKHYIEL